MTLRWIVRGETDTEPASEAPAPLLVTLMIKAEVLQAH
jgi:hypothetical protein